MIFRPLGPVARAPRWRYWNHQQVRKHQKSGARGRRPQHRRRNQPHHQLQNGRQLSYDDPSSSGMQQLPNRYQQSSSLQHQPSRNHWKLQLVSSANQGRKAPAASTRSQLNARRHSSSDSSSSSRTRGKIERSVADHQPKDGTLQHRRRCQIHRIKGRPGRTKRKVPPRSTRSRSSGRCFSSPGRDSERSTSSRGSTRSLRPGLHYDRAAD